MSNDTIFLKKINKENSKLDSGYVNVRKIPNLKECNYYVLPIPLDGEAPKQYIKAYFYYKNCPRKQNPSSWHGFFAKYGGKSYPHESVLEYTINKIGEYLGLEMNKTRLAIINGQIRFLSQDFIKKNKKLIHGIEVITEYFEDEEFVQKLNQDRSERRKYLTFEIVETAIQKVYPRSADIILKSLVKLITYDAIVGNNDRHFYNWGLIGDVLKINKNPPKFSPIYDTARALLWNKTDDKVKLMYSHYLTGSNEIDLFINKSTPRFSYESKPNSNHFEFIKFLVNYKKSYRLIVEELICVEKENTVLKKLKENEFDFFIKERALLMEIILKKRMSKLRGLL
ncbi:HipA domain-containing protein [Pseudozobellia sp. WGM2]|uniref:HipA domain-containing protein n=1 Tax=Pseudozobellia sp. WGM2 TaxID=2787625 RepID=UPI001ADF5A3E|nr:HipA domain-containing protein [Pseudozobellia sp. WGM2]